MCARAVALLTSLAGSVTACGSTANASVYDGGPLGVTAHPDAADADSPTGAYEGGIYGTRILSASGCGCDLGGAPVSPSVPLVTGLVGAGLIGRRRRRSDVP